MSDALLPQFPDPRVHEDPGTAPEPLRTWYALAAQSLGAATPAISDARDDDLRRALLPALERDARVVEGAIEHAPTPFVARHLWRLVDELWRATSGQDALAITTFALPLAIVAGVIAPGVESVTLPAVLPDVQAVARVMREGGALRGNQAFTFSAALVPASTLGIATWPAWQRLRSIVRAQHLGDDALFMPAPMHVTAGSESVHLRFLVGTAMAAAGVDLLAERTVGRWGAAVTKELVRQLAHEHVSVLPLPRPPQSPLPARHDGLVAQRDISAQLFASNAIRKLRAASGEPSAVISSHRAQDAPGGGELRLSLSSPFAPRDAEGFRCPIHPIEPVGIPLRMLLDLLRDCRVQDVRLVAGVHPDTAAGSGMPLFFRPDTIPGDALLQ
ncbi:MAG TPA: hypothetical protein VFC24_16815 [Casimicrobiaceae bacterium]|nr:hypothetical protein [Casimicrobiaceae bacterium]